MKLDESILRDLLKDIIGGTVGRAGKSKDEFVRILGREMGLAAAAVLQEPLERLVRSKKIQVTIELVDADPKRGKNADAKDRSSSARTKAKSARKSSST